jgi:MFS family permease
MTQDERHARKTRKWEAPANDDGYELTLHSAKRACSALFALLGFFWATALVLQIVPAAPHEQPLLTAVLVAVAVSVVTAAPFIREWMVRRTIGEHLVQRVEDRRPRAVYAMFANATAVGVLTAQGPALCGFVATAMTRSTTWYFTLIPLAIGTAATAVAWVALWPRRSLWNRWTWQARLRREGVPTPAAPADPSASSADPTVG